MRQIITRVLFIFIAVASCSANALLSLELNRGVAGAIPIAVVPFAASGAAESQDMAGIVANDLQNSGRFKVFGRAALKEFPSTVSQVSGNYFRKLGTDNIVIGTVKSINDKFEVEFRLLDAVSGQEIPSTLLSKKYTVAAGQLRAVAHHISDLVYEQITGVRGVFSTRLAYVLIQRSFNTPSRYVLEVSDMDGYNPRPLLDSPEPIMSPSWSPDGRQIAYVSFENKQAEIYLQDVVSGKRQLLSRFPGINGAPAWSPDGKKLAIVLSRTGSPNLYVIDIATRQLTQLTNDYYINTEPAFSPDGRSLIFTSNRSGGPQIYQIELASKKLSRLSYDGPYNARASYTHDGKHIAMIHRVAGIYNIGVLDLETGNTRVLTSSAGDSASPSLAPNGSMVLYDIRYNGRNVLGMVSADGRVQIYLPSRDGEAQDPAWSPFLT